MKLSRFYSDYAMVLALVALFSALTWTEHAEHGAAGLRGGEDNVFGTLLGVLIIAVIQSGMNMMKLVELDSNWQKVVFGVVLLLAVLFDSVNRRRR